MYRPNSYFIYIHLAYISVGYYILYIFKSSELLLKVPLLQVEDGVELQNPMKPPCEKPEDFINYAVFLTGKIHHDLKAVRSFREDRIKMYAKVGE